MEIDLTTPALLFSAISLIMAMIIMGSMVLTRKMDKDASDVSSTGGRAW